MSDNNHHNMKIFGNDPYESKNIFSGIANSVSIQVRCISLLCFPMYCGKAGRGILKAVVLTYVVAGKDINA